MRSGAQGKSEGVWRLQMGEVCGHKCGTPTRGWIENPKHQSPSTREAPKGQRTPDVSALQAASRCVTQRETAVEGDSMWTPSTQLKLGVNEMGTSRHCGNGAL